MTQVINKNFIAFDGTPITGRVPAQVIVYAPDGYKVPQELYGAVAHAYKLFCDSYNTSVAPFHVANRTFQDGSRVRMESNQGEDRVFLWVPPDKDDTTLRLYWSQSFLVDGGFDEGLPNSHNEPLSKVRNKLDCFAGENSEIFFRNISLDGVMEIWAEVKNKEHRAGSSVTHNDATEDQSDDDGIHTREVDVWFAGNRQTNAMDKFVPMPCDADSGAIHAFGNPYHGPIVSGYIADENGSIPVDAAYVSWPNTQLVKFDGIPEVPEALSATWRNSAILHGRYRSYFPVANKVIAFGMLTHLYRADDWTAYTISFRWVVATSTLTVVSKKCFAIPRGTPEEEEVEIYSDVLEYPAPWNVGDVDVYPRFNVSPNGKKVAILLSSTLKTTQINDKYNHRVYGENLAVHECIISGGTKDGPAVSCVVSSVLAYSEIYEQEFVFINTKVGLLEMPALIPTFSSTLISQNGDESVYEESNTFEPDYGAPETTSNYQKKIRMKRIVAAFYNNNNEIKVIETEFKTDYLPGQTLSIPSNLPTIATWTRKNVSGHNTIYNYALDSNVATRTLTQSVVSASEHSIFTNGVKEVVSSSTVSATKTTTLTTTYTTDIMYSNNRSESETVSANRSLYFVPTYTSLTEEYFGNDSGRNLYYEIEYENRYYMTAAASNNVVIFPTTDVTYPLVTVNVDYSVYKERLRVITPNGLHADVVAPESVIADAYPFYFGNNWVYFGFYAGAIRQVQNFDVRPPAISWNPVTDELLLGENKTWV